ncbi:DNA-packaging protein [Pseudomonas protegens]|uniref:DNA-packaging protein n=1 Tax=Pseudomonas protegens TaxID=380021 RepID=A0A2T6GS38_9PSED|nr:DNA-packaging protein [Pseudomonas protegens]PUA46964.1 DNA-packaging protein [Pseudomonas protegens]
MKGLLSFVTPATWYVAVIAAVVLGLHLNWQDGYSEGFAIAEAQGRTAVANLRLEHSEEQRRIADATSESLKQANEKLRVEQERGSLLATQFADAKEAFRKNTDTLNGEIARVTTLYRRTLKSAPEPLPAAVFTAGFVRVWNTANGISASVHSQQTQQAASGAAAPTDGAGAADSLDSGVTQALVLGNQVRNGELHSSCRAQLNRLIDWTLNASN